jgi:hypothetical protein
MRRERGDLAADDRAIRGNQLSRGRRGGRADVSNEVREGHVGLVTDG